MLAAVFAVHSRISMTDEDADLGVGHTVGGCATLGQACSGVPVLLPQLSEFERDTIIRRNKSVCEISLLLDIQL